MNRLILRKLQFENQEINFKDGVNYIIGPNSSGKTVIFSVLQYVLGLRKNITYSFITKRDIYLEIEINTKKYTFHRLINSREISITSSDTNNTWSIYSPEFKNFFYTQLKPSFDHEIDPGIINKLLKESFLSSHNPSKSLPFNNKMLILGINKWYEHKISKYIKELVSEIKLKEKVLNEIKSYKEDIQFVIKREISDESGKKIPEILENIFDKYYSSLSELNDLNIKSKQLLNKLKLQNEKKLNEVTDELDNLFNMYLNNILNINVSLLKVIVEEDSCLYGYSAWHNRIIKLLLEIVLQSQYKITNGVGLLVNDSNTMYMNNIDTSNIRKIIEDVCNNDTFQYIEFTCFSKGLDKENIVYELPNWRSK